MEVVMDFFCITELLDSAQKIGTPMSVQHSHRIWTSLRPCRPKRIHPLSLRLTVRFTLLTRKPSYKQGSLHRKTGQWSVSAKVLKRSMCSWMKLPRVPQKSWLRQRRCFGQKIPQSLKWRALFDFRFYFVCVFFDVPHMCWKNIWID